VISHVVIVIEENGIVGNAAYVWQELVCCDWDMFASNVSPGKAEICFQIGNQLSIIMRAWKILGQRGNFHQDGSLSLIIVLPRSGTVPCY
jgi:hypothetical protein